MASFAMLKFALFVLFSVVLRNGCDAHYHRAYFRERKDWSWSGIDQGMLKAVENQMNLLGGDTRINKLYLLGTHNSAAYNNKLPFVQCQAIDIWEQLKYGARVLDVRIRHIGDQFALHHGFIFLNKMFDAVMNPVLAFLRTHPSESVFLALQEDHTASNNKRSLCDTLNYYVDLYGRDNFYFIPKNKSLYDVTIRDIRGKVVLVAGEKGFDKCPQLYSTNNNCKKQMYWELSSMFDMYHKWRLIRDHHLDSVNIKSPNLKQCYINFLGGSNPYGLIYPDFVVSGHLPPYGTVTDRQPIGPDPSPSRWPDFPRFNCVNFVFFDICILYYEGMNVLFHDKLTLTRPNGLNIIMTDYFGIGLSWKVYEYNKSYQDELNQDLIF